MVDFTKPLINKSKQTSLPARYCSDPRTPLALGEHGRLPWTRFFVRTYSIASYSDNHTIPLQFECILPLGRF